MKEEGSVLFRDVTLMLRKDVPAKNIFFFNSTVVATGSIR